MVYKWVHLKTYSLDEEVIDVEEFVFNSDWLRMSSVRFLSYDAENFLLDSD